MYEVELKAWVSDVEPVRRTLERSCTFQRRFDKRDRYFTAPEGAPPQQFRLRRDGEHLVCTYKQKAVTEGVETNLEREFEVSDEEAFVGLVERIGCTALVNKHKQGSLYRYHGLNVELSYVEGLGTFLEIEKLVADDDAERARADREVREALSRLGGEALHIEARPYTQLLLDTGHGAGE
ncbi:MAG: class IV adenylate cyclase [Spirochaetota bacterium]